MRGEKRFFLLFACLLFLFSCGEEASEASIYVEACERFHDKSSLCEIQIEEELRYLSLGDITEFEIQTVGECIDALEKENPSENALSATMAWIDSASCTAFAQWLAPSLL